MEDYGQMAKSGASQYNNALIGGPIISPTVRENIDRRIANAEAQVVRLKETKLKLEKTGLLDVNISDLQEAMHF